MAAFSPLESVTDRWSWVPNPMEGFTVKSCYGHTLNNSISDTVFIKSVNRLWETDVPSKIHIFGWRLLQNRLATHDSLVN